MSIYLSIYLYVYLFIYLSILQRLPLQPQKWRLRTRHFKGSRCRHKSGAFKAPVVTTKVATTGAFFTSIYLYFKGSHCSHKSGRLRTRHFCGYSGNLFHVYLSIYISIYLSIYGAFKAPVIATKVEPLKKINKTNIILSVRI